LVSPVAGELVLDSVVDGLEGLDGAELVAGVVVGAETAGESSPPPQAASPKHAAPAVIVASNGRAIRWSVSGIANSPWFSWIGGNDIGCRARRSLTLTE
jgi:hypothetical protein